MNIKVHEHYLEIQKDPINEKEINITTVKFQFDEGIEGVKKAFFTLNEHTYMVYIENDQCNIPYEVLSEKGSLELGVVVEQVESDEIIKRYNPKPVFFDTWKGSLKEEYDNTEPITPTDKEQIEAIVQEVQTQMDNIDIEAEKVEHTATITITDKEGNTKQVQVLDGEQGPQGERGPAGVIRIIICPNGLPETGEEGPLYEVPKEEPTTQDLYDEYMWVDNKWELMGEKKIAIDLTDYVKNTDYATSQKAGVMKISSYYDAKLTNDGTLYANTVNYNTYLTETSGMFVSKGTLENVITGKGLTTKSYVDGLVGDIATALDTINGESVGD